MEALIALVPAIFVFVIGTSFESRTKGIIAATIAAVIAAAVGILTGNPAYMALDFFCVVIAYILTIKNLPKKAKPVPAPPPQTPAPQSGASQVFANLIVVAIFIVIVGFWLIETFKPFSNTSYAAPHAAPIAPAPKRTPQELYFDVLREVELRHPELKHNTPGHRQDLTNLVASTMDGYVKRGYAKHEALRMAVADMERKVAPAPSKLPSPASRNAAPSNRQTQSSNGDAPRPGKRPCIYKDVMSDTDYIACGVRPPQQ